MKRTRRIEVIRYTRRIVLVKGSDATAIHNPATDPTISDIILDEQEVALPAPEEEEDKGCPQSMSWLMRCRDGDRIPSCATC